MNEGVAAARRVRIAVCGFGASATYFHLPLCSRQPFERVVAFDPVAERRQAAIDAGFAGAADVSDMSALVRERQIDIVVTTSPTAMHAEHATTALRAGAHVIVDKPVAPTSSSYARLLTVAAEERRAVVPFHNRAFDDDHRIALTLLRGGRLGRLLRIESAVGQWGPSCRFAVGSFHPRWRTEARYGGGALADWGPHKLEQLLAIFDRAMPDEVAAATAGGVWSKDVEDVVDAWMRWGEVTAHLVISFAERTPLPRLRLVGSEATLTVTGNDAEGVVALDSGAGCEEWPYRNEVSAAFPIYGAALRAAVDGDLTASEAMSRNGADVYRLMDRIRDAAAPPARRRGRAVLDARVVADDGEWDELVDRAQGATLFHSSRWTASSPRRFLRIGVRSGGVLQAGLIAEVDDEGRGTRGSLAPYLGPLAANGAGDSALRMLGRALAAHLPSARFPVSPWSAPIHQLVCANDFRARLLYTSVVDLSDPARTRERFAANLARNIAAAEHRLAACDDASIDELRPLVERTFARQHLPVWFDWGEVRQCFASLAASGRARCFLVRNDGGAAIAGAGIVWDRHRAYYLLGGYDAGERHRGASSLALWRAMQFVRAHANIAAFDLEGSHHPAIHRFFDQFGGRWLPFAVVTPGAEGYE